MQQTNIINMNHNRSTALERSIKITGGGGLNRFYGIPTSPSASIMAQICFIAVDQQLRYEALLHMTHDI